MLPLMATYQPSRLHLAYLRVALALAIVLVPCAISAGVWLSSLMGTCFDEEGKPVAGAVLRFTDPANGRHFEVKSNAEGRFHYIAVEPSHYRLEIFRTRHQQISFPDVYLEWSSQPLLVEVNLQENSVRVTRQVILVETLGSEQPAPAIAVPDNADAAIVRAINGKIAAAKTFMDAGDWDNALTAARAATAIDPKRDLSWAWLAEIFCEEASHTTAHTDSMLQSCIQNYKYAIAIAPNATYYNNLGAAYSAMKQWEDAAGNFRAAIQLNPDHATLYHKNLGGTLLKQAESGSDSDTLKTLQLAEQEFSLAAAASPPVAETYYWKGLCQLRLAASEVPGSSYRMADESLRHYLQLSPNGQYASQARAMSDGLQDLAAAAGKTASKP